MKWWIIAKNTLGNQFSIKKTLGYLIPILVVTTILFVKSAHLHTQFTSYPEAVAYYTSLYGVLSYLIVAGIPFLIFIANLSATSISKEINDGTALLIFSRPVRRGELIIGKFVGLLLYSLFLSFISFFLLPSFFSFNLNMDATSYSKLLVTSIVGWIYSFFPAIFILSLGILFSTIFKRSGIAITLLLILVMGAFFLPFMTRVIGKGVGIKADLGYLFGSNYLNLYHIFGLWLHKAHVETFNYFSGTFLCASHEQCIFVPMNFFVNVILFLSMSSFFLFIASFILNRMDIS